MPGRPLCQPSDRPLAGAPILPVGTGSRQCRWLLPHGARGRSPFVVGGNMDRPENILPITALKVGEPAFIVSINARGELARRIRDMGLGSGMPVSVVGYAPLRDPLALRCAEVNIALRRREDKAIMVRHNSEPQAPAAAKAPKR